MDIYNGKVKARDTAPSAVAYTRHMPKASFRAQATGAEVVKL